MKVLITGGMVYGRLDDNKLVGNRVRGLWAMRFARWLAERGHQVTLLLPDNMDRKKVSALTGDHENIDEFYQTGFHDYRRLCIREAIHHDAAVMSAAVVNWIPANPIKGKMETKGYEEGDIIDIPFMLAPRVINEMKLANPKLTLIGCKMLIGSTPDELVSAAYGVLLAARCNVVIANDMKHGLKLKRLVYKDRSVHDYDNDFEGFYEALEAVINDEHYRTVIETQPEPPKGERELFARLIEQHRRRFLPVEEGRAYGAIALNIGIGGWLVSPREKGPLFTAEEAVVVRSVGVQGHGYIRHDVVASGKASLNAPLLIRALHKFDWEVALHFHEQIDGLPTLPYAPPGTVRDNDRDLPTRCRKGFNIEGHGCVIPG